MSVKIKKYELLQFHFHNPSEYKMRGKWRHGGSSCPQERGGRAGGGWGFISAGKENALVKAVWDNLPADVGKEKSVGQVTLNPDDFLPAKKIYSNYPGSLATPPASRG